MNRKKIVRSIRFSIAMLPASGCFTEIINNSGVIPDSSADIFMAMTKKAGADKCELYQKIRLMSCH